VYDVFTVKEGEQIFLAAVTDTQWKIFCEAFGYGDLFADPRLKTNNDRVHAREWLIPQLRERLAVHAAAELKDVFERHGLPFAPITKPEELFDDQHLNATGGLAPLTLPDGRETKVPLFPFTLDGERLPVRLQPPKLGEHTRELLGEAGYTPAQLDALQARGIINGELS
jgi:crotonobetainyl-CoA:carnitine CoA-transferase CaiB-like acyl-CoA transferase